MSDIEDCHKDFFIEKLHEEACKNNKNTYLDPYTGYKVMTRYFLEKNKCCGNKCRHCPWNHINVKK
jgi:hypothetical protein